jgi:transposase
VYHLLKSGTTYREPGASYFDQLDAKRATKKWVKRLEQLGHTVTFTATTS